MTVSPFVAAMPVWQDPYVEVIKFGMNHRNVGWHAQGDVEQVQDQQIHKHVFKIRGAIAASNYLRVPRFAATPLTGLSCVLPVALHPGSPGHNSFGSRHNQENRAEVHTQLHLPVTPKHWDGAARATELLELHTFNQYSREQFHHLKTLPPPLRFPEVSGKQYDWQIFPAPQLPSPKKKVSRPRRSLNNQLEAGATDSNFESERSPLPAKQRPKSPTQTVSPRTVCAKSSPATREHNLHRDRNSILARADQIVRDAGISQSEVTNNRQSKSSMQSATLPVNGAFQSAQLKKNAVASVTRAEWPDPILELKHIAGFSNAFPNALMWLSGTTSCCIYSSFSTIVIRDFQTEKSSTPFSNSSPDKGFPMESGGENQSVAATKGGSSINPSGSGAIEYFLRGHTAAVCGMALSSDESLLASVEEGSNSVRMWHLPRRACVTVLKAQARGVHALCFSLKEEQTLRLCAVGRDDSYRMQIFVWDCSALRASINQKRGETGGGSSAVPIIARQTCDFPVTTIAFSPYEPDHLVSCGKENVRFWRLRNSHLSGSPVILNEYSRGTVFTDLGFDPVYQAFPSNIPRMRPLYVSSSLGTLLLINYDTRDVVCVYQLHDAAINCLSVNEGFCVTGSEDHFLRVWPLDFTDFFLEAQHEAGVASVEVSLDGLKVLVGSRNGAIGVLDISDQRYDTILRSHTSEITTMALTSISLLSHEDGGNGDCGAIMKKDEIVTTSRDGTLRIWNVVSGQQAYEFDVQKDQVACLVVSPVENGIIAVGFASGCVRIFDMRDGSMTSVLREFQQHQSAIRCIQYDRDGEFLYTSAAGQQLCMYDALQREYAPVKMLIVDLFAESGKFCLSSDKKYVAMISADQQSVVLLHSRTLLPCSTIKPSQHSHSQAIGDTMMVITTTTASGSAHHKEQLKELLISRDASELLVLSKTDRLYVFSMHAMQFVQAIPLLGQQSITAFTLSPNLKYMVTGGADGSLCVWRWDEKQRFSRKQQSFLGQSGEILRVCFTDDGKFVVASGNSSTIFIWDFHGESGPAKLPLPSPALASEHLYSEDKTTTHSLRDNDNAESTHHNGTRDNGNTESSCNTTGFIISDLDGADRYDPEEMSPSLHIPVPSSKPKFSLQLAMDALVLKQNEKRQDEAEDSRIETSTLTISATDRGSLRMSSVVFGLNPEHVAWSYPTGCLVFAVGGVLVVEKVKSGQQNFHYGQCAREDEDHAVADEDTKGEIVLMRLSPSRVHVATVTSQMDSILMTRLGSSDNSAKPATRVILLPAGVISIDVMEFVHEASSSSSNSDEDGDIGILCLSCTTSEPGASTLFLASVATCTIIWSRTIAGGDRGQSEVREIIPIGHKKFVTFSGDKCCLEMHEIMNVSLHPMESDSAGSRDRVLSSRTLLNEFPNSIQIVCANPIDALDRRRRYLLCVDDEAFCFVYDLARECSVVTTQLMLRSEEKTRAKIPIDFLEWIMTSDKSQCLVRGSRAICTLYIHQFPVKTSRTAASVDWQLVARGGLPLLYHVVLDSFPRSVSVDPLRGLGVIATQDGTVSLLVFKDGTAKRVLKRDRRSNFVDASKAPISDRLRSVSWALNDSVLLTLAEQDSTIRCWLPEVSREVAQFQVRGAKCTSMAVSNSSSSSSSFGSGSILLAGYEDGTLRVFDLNKMKLIAQSQLPVRPRSATRSVCKQGNSEKKKSLRTLKRRLPANGNLPDTNRVSNVEQIHFVGSCAVVVVLADHRVLLVDLSEVLLQQQQQQQQPQQQSQGSVANASVKKPKPSFSDNVHHEREIVYRELVLSGKTSSRERKRVGDALVPAEIKVGDVDTKTQVEPSFFAAQGSSAHSSAAKATALTVYPFLLTTTTSGGHNNALVKVFGWTDMMASTEVELSATDEWCTGVGSRALARFVACEQPLVLYTAGQDDDASSGNNKSPTQQTRVNWCFEIRDYLQQCVLRRIDLGFGSGGPCTRRMGLPTFMMRLSADTFKRRRSNQNAESMLMLVADVNGAMFGLDLEQNCAILIDSEALIALSLQFSNQSSAFSSDNRLTLTSRNSSSYGLQLGNDPWQSECLVIANISFEPVSSLECPKSH